MIQHHGILVEIEHCKFLATSLIKKSLHAWALGLKGE